MNEEVLFRRGTTLVRRLSLAPGEAMPWHRDPYHRVSVVLQGERLVIEYRDGSESNDAFVSPGQVDWDEPTDRVHRGRNNGTVAYEEVTVFFLDHPDADHQPREGSGSESRLCGSERWDGWRPETRCIQRTRV
jgi:quercetin dioxygenase-like cupin family protein